MRLDIRYTCCFEYGELVRESQNELRACPVSDARQTLLGYRVSTSPPARVLSFEDYWGTRVDAFGVREPHIFLEVTAEATVETRPTPLPARSPGLDALRDPAFVEAHWEHLQPTGRTEGDERVGAEARAQVALAGPECVGVALAIHRRVGTLLRRVPGRRGVVPRLDEVLDRGEGTARDHAHLAVAMARSVGLPARYASGYLFEDDGGGGPGPQGPGDEDGDAARVQTHAWFEVAVPGLGWLGLDPAGHRAVGLRHVKIGHGRDHDDVPPLRGTYSGPPDATLDVSVEMRRLAGAATALQHQAQQ